MLMQISICRRRCRCRSQYVDVDPNVLMQILICRCRCTRTRYVGADVDLDMQIPICRCRCRSDMYRCRCRNGPPVYRPANRKAVPCRSERLEPSRARPVWGLQHDQSGQSGVGRAGPPGTSPTSQASLAYVGPVRLVLPASTGLVRVRQREGEGDGWCCTELTEYCTETLRCHDIELKRARVRGEQDVLMSPGGHWCVAANRNWCKQFLIKIITIQAPVSIQITLQML